MRRVDPNRFLLLGAVTDWPSAYRRQPDHAPSPNEIAAQRRLACARIVQLRWLLAPELGYPTEPFRVWRRPSMPMPSEAPIGYTQTRLFGQHLVVLERPVVFARVQIAAATPGSVMAYAGAPYTSPLVSVRSFNAGVLQLELSGARIQTLLVGPDTTVEHITALDHTAANDKDWELIELVGLPVDGHWHGVFDLDQPQGLVSAPGDPRAAALDRFRRGAPFYGWDATIPGGGNAPPWKLANPKAMLELMGKCVLPPLLDMVQSRAPKDHAAHEVTHVLPPVEPLHPAASGAEAHARVQPLCNLLFGASTDPLVSLVSGFGTAFEDIDIPASDLGKRMLFNDAHRSDWDFMVTACYRRGADHQSEPIEYAAIVLAPQIGTAPPVPANMTAVLDGLRAPAATDADWHAIHRVGWDKLADGLPLRVGSYAFARCALAPAGPTVPLMGHRPLDDALQPISATTSPEQAALGRLQALDETYGLPSAPASNVLLYALAQQDLFGLWSGWATHHAGVAEPPVQPVSLLAARLEPEVAQAGATCRATLVIDFSWDWASRSLRLVEFVGRMAGQARPGNAPPADPVPVGLQTALAGGAGTPLRVVFKGAPQAEVLTGTAGLTATLRHLSVDGKTFLDAPEVVAGTRRYRLTVSGLSLDFDAAPRMGLTLWARGTEERAPNRVGDWSLQPLVASSADPRPPVLVMDHEDVRMASLADASGAHHAQLTWPPVAGASGYFVYTTTEIKLRADRGLPDPARSLTLSQRLAEWRAAFAADPNRRSWTRVNARPVTGTAMQVTLPRGSKEIHAYLVLGQSAGQVESDWPQPGSATGRQPICFAAPQLVRPAPPDIEVSRVLDRSVQPHAWRAWLRVRTQPGAPVARVDLHRVRVADAAVDLDAMGPPIARLTGTQAPFTVQPAGAQAIGTLTGLDPVEGSWRRVYYRAVAWGVDEPQRGLYGARSEPSALRDVVVPPATPPDLAALSWHWPGGEPGDVQIDSSTLAPIEETPLGRHRLRVDVITERADGSSAVLWRFAATPADVGSLLALPVVPPGTGTQGLWRSDGAGGVTALHLRVRRTSVDDALKVSWLLTDPLGRATERTLNVPAGAPLPPPDLLTPTVRPWPAGGFVVTFRTTAPAAEMPAGPYRLRVRYVPRPPSPFGHPLGLDIPRPGDGGRLHAPAPMGQPLPHVTRRGPPRPPWASWPQALTLDVALADIPLAAGPHDLGAGHAPITAQRTKTTERDTAIAVALRGRAGHMTLAIVAPDGRSASVQLDLG